MTSLVQSWNRVHPHPPSFVSTGRFRPSLCYKQKHSSALAQCWCTVDFSKQPDDAFQETLSCLYSCVQVLSNVRHSASPPRLPLQQDHTILSDLQILRGTNLHLPAAKLQSSCADSELLCMLTHRSSD